MLNFLGLKHSALAYRLIPSGSHREEMDYSTLLDRSDLGRHHHNHNLLLYNLYHYIIYIIIILYDLYYYMVYSIIQFILLYNLYYYIII